MTVDKTVIITGANSGLGFVAARTIAQSGKGWHVVLACRDVAKGEAAKQRISESTDSSAISVMELDLSSMQSVRHFAETFDSAKLPPLHGLINNAGMQMMSNEPHSTSDGFEVTFATNHLGHFLLTNFLLPKLEKPARIIVVGSGTHDPDTIDGRFTKPVFLGAKRLAMPESKKEMSGPQRYSTSKLANILFAYELAKRLENTGNTVNVFDPMATPDTNLVKNPIIRSISRQTWFLNMLRVKTSTQEKSGTAMARLLLDPKLERISGKYFRVNDEVKSSKQSYDSQLAKQLWADSLELTGIGGNRY
jgi:light-dependent protochlorophyllide reductase